MTDMFEHRSAPLLSTRAFVARQLRTLGLSAVLIAGSLAIGMVGYHWTQHLGWIDSFLNASMILTGMGPVNPMTTDAGKLFAGFYALFSGVAFLGVVGVLFAPLYHRFLHRFHVELDEGASQ